MKLYQKFLFVFCTGRFKRNFNNFNHSIIYVYIFYQIFNYLLKIILLKIILLKIILLKCKNYHCRIYNILGMKLYCVFYFVFCTGSFLILLSKYNVIMLSNNILPYWNLQSYICIKKYFSVTYWLFYSYYFPFFVFLFLV